MASEIGQAMADQFAAFRGGVGDTVTWNGETFAARVADVPRREYDFVASGLGINVAAGQLRTVSISPSLLSGSVPQEGDTLTLAAEPGATFQVLRRWTRGIGDIVHTVQLMVYRLAPADTATDAETGESGAGARKQYWPG